MLPREIAQEIAERDENINAGRTRELNEIEQCYSVRETDALEASSEPICDNKIDPPIIKYARIAFARILDPTS